MKDDLIVTFSSIGDPAAELEALMALLAIGAEQLASEQREAA